MAKLKKGILKKTSEREKCQRILKKARVDVYVPRSLEAWKFSTNISYVCIFEKNQFVQAYLTANNKYKKSFGILVNNERLKRNITLNDF